MAFIDKELTCRDCSNGFIFTAGEQEFYANKGLQNEPVRCPPCRASRKNNRLNEPEEGYVRYGVFASFGGRTPRQMHPATCADCGIMTEVPFQPRGDRPVYCSACYTKVKGAAEGQGAPKAETTAKGDAEAADGATDGSSDDEVKAETEGESAPAAEAEADGAADASSEEEVKAENEEEPAPTAEAEADGAADASSEEEVKAESEEESAPAAEAEAASEDEEKPEPVAEEAQASS